MEIDGRLEPATVHGWKIAETKGTLFFVPEPPCKNGRLFHFLQTESQSFTKIGLHARVKFRILPATFALGQKFRLTHCRGMSIHGSAAFSTFSRVPRVARELSTLPARVHHTTRAENDPQSPEHTIATMMTLAHAPVVAPVAARASVR
tara:strand:+ start:228 stop:671 length:444 start_codon:yes stop_codon:yes gene_type:complete